MKQTAEAYAHWDKPRRLARNLVYKDLRQDVPQSGIKLWIQELESRIQQRARFDASTAEQHVVGHLAKREFRGDAGHRKHRWSMQDAAKCFGELTVRNGRRRHS